MAYNVKKWPSFFDSQCIYHCVETRVKKLCFPLLVVSSLYGRNFSIAGVVLVTKARDRNTYRGGVWYV